MPSGKITQSLLNDYKLGILSVLIKKTLLVIINLIKDIIL